jgi:hypothetical protein
VLYLILLVAACACAKTLAVRLIPCLNG